MAGRLGILCQRVYAGPITGLSEYGRAGTIRRRRIGSGCARLLADPRSKHKLTNELLRHGDIERALVEWRSVLRHIVIAPPSVVAMDGTESGGQRSCSIQTASPTSTVDLGTLAPLQQRAEKRHGEGKVHRLWRNPSLINFKVQKNAPSSPMHHKRPIIRAKTACISKPAKKRRSFRLQPCNGRKADVRLSNNRLAGCARSSCCQPDHLTMLAQPRYRQAMRISVLHVL